MAVLLLAEITDGALNMDATSKAATAAKKLGDVTVLCAGAQAADAAAQAATIDGVSKVLCAEDASLGHRLAEPTAALIVSLAGDYSHIVAPSTTDAKNILPRVAALLDVMVLSDVTAVVDADTSSARIYAGNASPDRKIIRCDQKSNAIRQPRPLKRRGRAGRHAVETHKGH